MQHVELRIGLGIAKETCMAIGKGHCVGRQS